MTVSVAEGNSETTRMLGAGDNRAAPAFAILQRLPGRRTHCAISQNTLGRCCPAFL